MRFKNLIKDISLHEISSLASSHLTIPPTQKHFSCRQCGKANLQLITFFACYFSSLARYIT